MISKDTLEKVYAALDIVEVISTFVQLKRNGQNYIGRCPFHAEKTSSFTVSPRKEIFKCFGCGRSGQAVSFVMQHENFSFRDAIIHIAQQYNIEVEETFSSDKDREKATAREAISIVNKFAAAYFAGQLKGSPAEISYLKERGITGATAAAFMIGSDPYPIGLLTEAQNAKYSTEILAKAGLINQATGSWHDTFRHRIIFPIQNINGQVLGFGGRIFDPNSKQPKYINSAENDLYSKKNILYGLFHARSAISQLDEAIMVEGYMDVISLHQAQIQNVVATCGTSITTEQLKLLKRYCKRLLLIYDGDAAGLKAITRVIPMALEQELTITIVTLPPNEDPDSYVKQFGRESFITYLQENRKDIVEFYAGNFDLGNPEIKDATFKELAAAIGTIPNDHRFRREALYQKLADVYQVHISAVPRTAEPAPAQPIEETTEDEKLVTLHDLEVEITRCLLLYFDRPYGNGFVFTHILETLPDEPIEDYQVGHATRFIHHAFQECLNDGAFPDINAFLQAEDPAVVELAASVLMDEDLSQQSLPYIEQVDKAIGMFTMQFKRHQLEINRQRMETGEDGWTVKEGLQIDAYLKKEIREIAAKLKLTNFQL